MGPKRRPLRYKGKKRQKGKKKKRQATTGIEREEYEATVSELTEILKGKDALVKELEYLKSKSKSRYEQAVEDTNDICDGLQREINEKKVAIEQMQREIAVLQKLRAQDRGKWQEQIKMMKAVHAKTVKQLQLENEALGDKLSSNEEHIVKKKQIDQKIADLEMQLAEKTQEYENALYLMEKDGIIDHDRLRKEMHRRVEETASACMKFSRDHMQETVKRAIKEAVKMGIELKRAGDMAYELSEENQKLKKDMRCNKNELSIEYACENEMGSRYKAQNEELKHLLELFDKYQKHQRLIDEFQKQHGELAKIAEEQRKWVETSEFNIKCFADKIKLLTEQKQLNKAEIENKNKTINTMEEVIRSYITCIQDATVEMTEEVNLVEYAGKRRLMLLQLLDIMDQAGEMGDIDYWELTVSQKKTDTEVLAEDSIPPPNSPYSSPDTSKVESTEHKESRANIEEPQHTAIKGSVNPEIYNSCKTTLSEMGLSKKFQQLDEMMKGFRR